MDARNKRKKVVGRNVAVARKDEGYNQTDFARLLGTTQVQLSKWENGHYRPSDDYLEKIALLTQPQLRLVLRQPPGRQRRVSTLALTVRPDRSRVARLRALARPHRDRQGHARTGQEEERRLRELVHDERAAYNGIYAPAERHIKAVRHVPPRPPQS